jgi:hypothetical protein
MEKRLKRIEIILIGFSILTLINLVTVFLMHQSVTVSVTDIESEELKKLPNDVTRELLDKTVYKIKTEFNRSNWEEIHTILENMQRFKSILNKSKMSFKN